ncbi:MAG: UDP-glucose/GDP-mannose dehydrogenase family protein [Dehalococcoidia bacterium]|nr:UDP-glucose/GDP-mannose dehydrogenase family protein [Dehalococcoidia bacterium]
MGQICVVGAGHVGLVTGACFADLGNQVTCLDINSEKIERLQKGILPIYEPGLEELVRRNLQAGRLSFTTDYCQAVEPSDFVFIAVDTPSGTHGETEMRFIRSAAEMVGRYVGDGTIIVNKSTVPIGTGDLVAQIIQRVNGHEPFAVVSNPEFLREGSAVSDFMHPDRIVLGSSNREAANAVARLHSAFECPIIVTDLRTAEMIKYASNAFLATRISFINEIAAICDELGADIKVVARGMGLDKRIGPAYLDAGLGYGGSCFPKDVQALSHMAAAHGRRPQLLRAVMDINRDQRRLIVHRLRQLFGSLEGRQIGLLGLSFKPNTDDMREAASLEVTALLIQEGAKIRAYDPEAIEVARPLMRDVTMCSDPYQVAQGADALIIVTEWNEFKQLNLLKVKSLLNYPDLIDGRNIFEPQAMQDLGFVYYGIGRGQKPLAPIAEAVSESVHVKANMASKGPSTKARPPQIPPGGSLGEDRA